MYSSLHVRRKEQNAEKLVLIITKYNRRIIRISGNGLALGPFGNGRLNSTIWVTVGKMLLAASYSHTITRKWRNLLILKTIIITSPNIRFYIVSLMLVNLFNLRHS